MSPERPPKVLISYSHDSAEHEDRVLDLAERLVEKDGIDVSLDRFVNPPPASWPKWMSAEMKDADFILVVCSATYLAKVEGKVKSGEGKGIKWESLLSYQQIYDNDSDSSRFIPVLLKGGKYEHIPDPMRGSSHYRPEEDAEYEKLIRHITNQPETPKPKPGPLRKLPPKQRQAAKNPVTKPAQDSAVSKPWNVPHARNDAFTGREQLLTDLRADLLKKGKQALFGLGGVGKTQIAVEYAYRHRDEYTAVFWSFAGTEQSVRGAFSEIAGRLNLPERESAEQSKVTDAVKNWLEQNTGWLLVLDNADDPAMLKPFLPQQGKGHVLVTSRAHQLQKIGIFSPREVDVLSPDEARKFLLLRTGKEAAKKSPDADALAKELGYLPLALEQTAAYIVEKGASFASYLAGFKKQRQALLNKQEPVLGNEAKEQQKRTVATTWAVNFADIEKNFSASAELLKLSAFWAPDAIPLELFEKGAKEMPEKLAAKLTETADNPLVMDELLSPLLRYSLVRRNDEKRTYSIHPMVQEVVREGLTKEEKMAWAERAVRAVNAAFPYIQFENWPECDRLLTHALACAGFINSYELEFHEGGRLLNQAGYYLAERAEYGQAEPLYRRALAVREKLEGPEHPKTAQILNNLADLYRKQRRDAEAEPLQQRSLAIWEKTMGPNHPDTANSLNNLASLYDAQGRHKEAEPLFRRALEILENATPEPEPSGLARTLNNLGGLYYAQGRYKEAEPLLQRALAISEEALGPGHPDITYGLNTLALLYDDQGRLEEAEPLFRRALEIREKTLGPEHPSTATSLNNLASWFQAQGKWEEAEALYGRALAVVDNVLGSEHPNTILMRNNLIQVYRERGKDAEAKALEKRAKGKAK
jgi:tetratricopeptide (TPR) repeat protein